jgi:hypothetical protein
MLSNKFRLLLILIACSFIYAVDAKDLKNNETALEKNRVPANSGEFICSKQNEQFFNDKNKNVQNYLNENCDPTRSFSMDTRAHGHGGLICCIAK